MKREPAWRRYLRFRGADPAADLEDELRHHLVERAREYERGGLSPEEAAAAALDRLGDPEGVRRACARVARRRRHRERGRGWLHGVGQDVGFAVRALRGSPILALIATLTIALGIGATTTMFTIVQAVVLEPLPFESPDRVVVFEHFNRRSGTGAWLASFPLFLDYESQSQTFSRVAAWRPVQPTLRSADGRPPTRVSAVGVTAATFELLGVEAALGRTFAPDEEVPGGPPTAVLGHGFWQGRFGGDPGVIGRTLDLDGALHTVIGVLPRSFRGASVPHASTAIWLPYRNSSVSEGTDVRSLMNVNVIARLAEGVQIAAARADVDRIMTGLAAEYGEHAETGVRLVSARDAVVGRADGTMWLLFGTVGLVLLIAATNVTNLLLGRAADRAREVAVRAALGASRLRIVRLVVCESLVLALVGGALGVALAFLGVDTVRAIDPGSIPRLDASSVRPLAIAFVSFVTVLVAVAVGVVPALHATGPGHTDAIKASSRSSPRSRVGLRRLLVVSQVAVATVLLVGAGLMLRSLSHALAVDPGFDPENTLTARIAMPTAFVSDDWPQHVAFFQALVEDVGRIPGVRSVAAAYQGPTDGGWHNGFTFADRPQPAAGDLPHAVFRPVTPGYFEALGIALRSGRPLRETDDETAPGAVVVNQAFVRAFLPDREPVGARIDYGHMWNARPPEYEIVGVVEDVRFYGPDQPVEPATYFPHAQQPVREMSLFVRTADDPTSLLPGVREAVERLDPTLPLDRVTTLAALSRGATANRRFLMIVFATFASMAVLLAATGLYGVVAFLVRRRSREIGVRLALGAGKRSVLGLVVRQSMSLVTVGLLIGSVGAYASSRLLAGLLFGVEPTDPATMVGSMFGLVLAGLLASAGPAIHALHLDPAQTLRAD
ncbi:MAG: ABC transporter permease [Gemmatimonadetes bacterium]|nr:ABC transporter permease [Gemmatimonadota bacterium]